MVKLVDFSGFQPFNRLRQEMGADLIQEFKFDSGILPLDEDFLKRLDGEGVEIDSLAEIEFREDKTLAYRDQRVLIYIRDVNVYRKEIRMPRFHVATCKTLEGMWQKKRSERYVLYRRENGIFQINLMQDSEIDIRHVKLDVCRNCLTQLNWNNYNDENKKGKDNIVAEFSISDFFTKFTKSLLSATPSFDSDTAPLNRYPKDWDIISREIKIKAKWRCENNTCNIDLSDDLLRKFLHVHHIDGQRNNNKPHNLKALCIKCHAEEPHHGHMKVSGGAYEQFLSLKN